MVKFTNFDVIVDLEYLHIIFLFKCFKIDINEWISVISLIFIGIKVSLIKKLKIIVNYKYV